MSSDPPITPEIEKALQLKHTMDEISGQLPHKDPKHRHQKAISIAIPVGGFFLFAVPWMISGLYNGADLILMAMIIAAPLLFIFAVKYILSSPRRPPSFRLTRTDFVFDKAAYRWATIRQCQFYRTQLLLILKNGQKIQWGPFSTEHHDSLQWLCERINHRAGLAGDEAEVPENIKAMRRQKDSV